MFFFFAVCLLSALSILSCTPEERANLLSQITDQKTDSSSSQDDTPEIPVATLSGSFAFDDGTGLSALYYTFLKGVMYKYSVSSPVVLAEGYMWHVSADDFALVDTGDYVVDGGVLYCKGKPYGSISITNKKMTLAGQNYTKIAGFMPQRYSEIIVAGGLEQHMTGLQQTIALSVNKSIPSGVMTVSTECDWLSVGELADGVLPLVVNENNTIKSRQGAAIISYPGATDVVVTIEQDPALDNTAANCYIVSSPGTYSFRTVMGNSRASVGRVATAEVLWESFGTSTVPSKGDIIKSVSYTKEPDASVGSIVYTTPSVLRNGNAVIAAKDASGNILWSWHIWVCEGYDPIASGQEYYKDNNIAATMMDRNLGATSATPGDVGALGLLYQWGRKDPFLGSSSISSNSKAASTLTWPSTVSSDAINGTIEYAVAHPTTFITYNSSNSDWYYTGSSSTDNTRWQTSKTIYDPCPHGWKVSVSLEIVSWEVSWAVDHSYGLASVPKSWDNMNLGNGFSDDFGIDGFVWCPAAGYYSSSNGGLCYVGLTVGWWSCECGYYPYPQNARCLSLGNNCTNFYGWIDVGRASGHPVRCQKE